MTNWVLLSLEKYDHGCQFTSVPLNLCVMLMAISIHRDANRQGTGVAAFSVVSLEKQSTQTNRRAAEFSTAIASVATLHDGFQPALE